MCPGPPGRSPHSGQEAGVCREQDNVLSGGSQEWEKGPTRALKRGRWGRLWMSARQASVTLCCRWRQRWGSEAPSGRGLSRCRNPAPGFLTPTVSLQQRPPPRPPAEESRRDNGGHERLPRAFSSPSVSARLSSPGLQAAATRDAGKSPTCRGCRVDFIQATRSPAGFSPQHSTSNPCPTEAHRPPTNVKGGLPWWFSG